MAKLIIIFAGVLGKERGRRWSWRVQRAAGALPWFGCAVWLLRMATSGRYRAGLRGRLGWMPEALKARR